MTRVGTGQSSPPLPESTKAGNTMVGGGGDCCQTGSVPGKLGCHPEDTCVPICVWVRRTQRGLQRVGRVSGAPGAVTSLGRGSGWRD